MITAKCIQKFRNKHNQIIGYRLQDTKGNVKDVTSDQLKNAIKNQQIEIINLTLTSDNRLIDSAEHSIKSEEVIRQNPQLKTDNSNYRALLTIAKAIPDFHYVQDMLIDVTGLSLDEISDENCLMAIREDPTSIIDFINYTFSDENLDEDEYALENFEINLKSAWLNNNNSIIESVKQVDAIPNIGVDTTPIKKFINECNLSKLKGASKILSELTRLFNNDNSERSFERISVYKNPFHFDGIIDLMTAYDVFNSDGSEDDIIAVVANGDRIFLQHLWIDEDTKENNIIKEFEIKKESIESVLESFKAYFDDYMQSMLE